MQCLTKRKKKSKLTKWNNFVSKYKEVKKMSDKKEGKKCNVGLESADIKVLSKIYMLQEYLLKDNHTEKEKRAIRIVIRALANQVTKQTSESVKETCKEMKVAGNGAAAEKLEETFVAMNYAIKENNDKLYRKISEEVFE